MPARLLIRVGILEHLTRDTERLASRASVIPTLDVHTPHAQVLLAIASPRMRLHGVVLGESIAENPTRIAVSSATVCTQRLLGGLDRRVDERRERFHHSVKGGSPSGSSVTDVDAVGGDDMNGMCFVFVSFTEDSVLGVRLTNRLRANVPIVVSPLSMKVYINDRALTNNL
jgi:hypothetical protein